MTRRASPSGSPQHPPMRRSRHPKLWILRDPETLNLLFQAYEDMTTLREQCERKVAAAREEEHIFRNILMDEDESGLRRWSRLLEMITPTWSLLDHTVRTNRFDPAEFQEAYREMWRVRTAWTRMESHRGPISRIAQITEYLRQLLIRYAQAQADR